MKRLYFTDFDGTITKVDTTDAMTKTFAADGWQGSLCRWAKGKISTIGCAREIFRGFAASPKELADFLLTIPVDRSFLDFTRYVEKRGEQLYILSDGYDFNIGLILKKAGISHLPYYSNRLVYGTKGWDIESPYLSECGKCGTCKKSIVRSLKEAAQEVVYIGDGLSDRCGCREADTIFAKGQLLEYCQKQQIPCVPFQTFDDILAWLNGQNRMKGDDWLKGE